MIKTEIPLFPLNTVLFPGAHLPLRIFEQRYIDMVRECSASDSCFGVCLVNEAMHQDQHASHRQTGTTAEICDWFTTSDGLLGIIARGRQKFSVSKTGIRENGLLTGEVELLAAGPLVTVPAEFAVLSSIVARFMEAQGKNYPDFLPEHLQDANWVGHRLAELLPLENPEKQDLLEISAPLERLQQLVELLPRFQ